ncbi:hypothetical protein GPECTOR_22g814 [Gonium pectorale]|uniref:G8 domain-containing protein n=1 Tax=Gonium pectorale TaxID=33097 RepID=A0A150GHF5_GONPE|nr:hypothetical protein GPECTOR_22g814 [Gonium pectorale]|eukprot:KXZ49223.1 hypothetical protein GPECTOR_22g814 [Gonium pectorale]
MTPTLLSIRPSAVFGINPVTFTTASTNLSIYGTFLTDPSVPAISQITVTVANKTCAISDVSPFVANATLTTTRIACNLPALPVGSWPINVQVAGLGLTRPPATVATDLPVINYTLRVTSYNSPAFSAASTLCWFSYFGGGTFSVNAFGLVKDNYDAVLGRAFTPMWEAGTMCPVSGVGSPPCIAAQTTAGQANSSTTMWLIPVSSDGVSATVRLTRFRVPNPEAFAGNNTAKAQVRYRPRVTYLYPNNPQFELTLAADTLYFCGGRTPLLSGVSPSTIAPDAGASGTALLSLTWFMSGVGSMNDTLRATPAGLPSNATVEFTNENGNITTFCNNVTVTASRIQLTNYSESISCIIPSYLPAANYTIWLCVQPSGCGFFPTYTVPLSVSSVSPASGSSSGGDLVTIIGNGFDTNVSRVAVRFGSSACKVTSSNGKTLTCVMAGLDARPASPVAAPLFVTPTLGAAEQAFSALTFTFNPALESIVSSITPTRGSTEGGTPVTIAGSGFAANLPTTVTIGGTTCLSVAVVSSTSITCTTGKPPSDVLRSPLPVTVFQDGRGNCRGNVSYQYIDLWSRNSTWGGGPLPGLEDSVVIPSNVTVLLDISPPKLYLLVLQGNLVFDDTLSYLNLQADYILVSGGNFTIGSADKPYPGRANITLHGTPSSRDLPMYGAKALAVRQGVVTFFGQPKVPHYTTLNSTVDPGATSITVNGVVNWQVGDRIVIASSSFFANEVSEASITAVDTSSTPGCSVLSLDTPTKYVHLGEIHSQPGVATPLDMRAEVAVLTRNILLTGDSSSAVSMFGAQVMVNSPSGQAPALLRFDNVEVAQSGQAFHLGRYSIHWHLMGDLAFQSWVRGCSIHHTYNRAAAVHGTHRVLLQNNVAHDVMGHAFFLEDGIETGNVIEGNLGVYTRDSYALLNTDTTPATFWITNPNNTVRHNRAAGSLNGFGFWYRFLDNPEGPSYTVGVCPKFTPLLEFTNNTAHSNLFNGLHIHPEYYPRNVPCNGFSVVPFAQQPAVFNGMTAYKNGIKGAAGTQVGLVQFANFVLGDNGGGPSDQAQGGKDVGAGVELSWVVDDRNRYDVALREMAGLNNATIYARTTTGSRGSAGAWTSSRRVAGVATQSPVQGDEKHSALMSLLNVTFVDFGGSNANFTALEACGRCKQYQGGSTTFTANISFANSDGSKPALSYWSWGHQGVYLDTDGSLLNARTLPDGLLPSWSLGAGATWHSAVDSELFDPDECVYVRGAATSNDGAFCRPSLTFRRVMLNGHGPEALANKTLQLVSLATNRTSLVRYSDANEKGYQFTVATGRDYWVHWNVTERVDPEQFTLHKMDGMDSPNFVYISTKYVQLQDHFNLNGIASNLTILPAAPASAAHGSAFYNKTMAANSWWWGNANYNDTKLAVLLAGRSDAALAVAAQACPAQGCGYVPPEVIETREGTLYWSDAATWASRPGGKPVEGDNVTIPFGWDLVIDESPPPLGLFIVQGEVEFDPAKDVILTAIYILVTGRGVLRAGSASAPHPGRVTIKLVGTRDTPQYLVDSQLNLGSKVLAAVRGGTIDLYGREVDQRWVRLNSPASEGDWSITVSNPNHGWRVGDKVLITSTTFNALQSETHSIAAIQSGGAVLLLDSPLQYPHGATVKAYPGGPTVDMRAEVAMLSSNILITNDNSYYSFIQGTEAFGARVVVSGNSTGRLSNIAMEYCGQAGFTDRACVLFDRLSAVAPSAGAAPVPNPSLLRRSALAKALNSNLRIGGSPGVAHPINVTDNVMYESLGNHGVEVITSGNIIKGNLVLGATKDTSGRSSVDVLAPSNFKISSASNWVENNVAAGSDRYGFTYYGVPCSAFFRTGSFLNNTAHSCLAGMWLQASADAVAEGCTALRNFTTYMNWDFGIVTTRGLPTDLAMENVNVLDTKHSGVTVFRASGFTEKGSLSWRGGLLAGQSSDTVCAACASLSDLGCHKSLAPSSYNKAEPFTPAVGLQSAMFALAFSAGPETEAYDKPTMYSAVHGRFDISGVTVADFLGPAGCNGDSGAGSYAFANHPEAPDAFHPHFFSQMNVVNMPYGQAQGMFFHTAPNPGWRNDADCGTAVYARADGTQIPLNCAGPAHAYWRDLDGSLIAGGDPTGAGTIAGVFTEPRIFPLDQGSPVLPGACTYTSVFDSYRCGIGSTTFLLDERLKPKPIPPAGIWGDPQHFVLESRDRDMEDRNFGPVFFNVSGSIDVVTSTMDYGNCTGTSGCQKRLSTFWTYLPSFQTVYVTFAETPSQNFRLWYPYADSKAELVLVFATQSSLNRRFVWLAAGNGPVSGRVPPESKPVAVGDGTGHGAHFWDQDNSLMYVKIMGGKSLEIRTENVVMISQSFALTVDQFYGTSQLFLSNLASAMGIEPERMYIARVVPGSATVTTAIGPRWSSIGAIDEPVFGRSGSALGSFDKATTDATVADLVDVMLAYTSVMSDPSGATAAIGVTPLGGAVSDLSALKDPLVAQQVAAAAQQYGLVTTAGVSGTPSGGATPSPTATPATEAPTGDPAATTAPSGGSNPTVTPGLPATDPALSEEKPPVQANEKAAAAEKKGLSGSELGGVVVAAVGALVIGGVVAGAIVLRKRRRSASHAAPEGGAPPGERPSSRQLSSASGVFPSPQAIATRSSHAGSISSAREGFVVPNPAYEGPLERRQRSSLGGLPPAAGDEGSHGHSLAASRAASRVNSRAPSRPGSRPGSAPGTPRSGAPSPRDVFGRASGVDALAAGILAAGEPEVIRPAPPPVASSHSPAKLGQSRSPPPEAQPRPKAAAELRSDSLRRNSAPTVSARDLASRVAAADEALAGDAGAAFVPERFASGADAFDLPVQPERLTGTARPLDVPLRAPPKRLPALNHPAIASAPGTLSPAAQAIADANAAAAAGHAAGVPAGETPVEPVRRTLETMESFVPRPRSKMGRASNPSGAPPALNIGMLAEPQEMDLHAIASPSFLPGAAPGTSRAAVPPTVPHASFVIPATVERGPGTSDTVVLPSADTLVLMEESALEATEPFAPTRPRTAAPRSARTSHADPNSGSAVVAAAAALAATTPRPDARPRPDISPVGSPSAAPGSPATAGGTAPSAGGDTTLVISIERTLETMESRRPRTSQARSARPSAAGAGIAAGSPSGTPGSPALEFRGLPTPPSAVRARREPWAPAASGAGAGHTLVIPEERATPGRSARLSAAGVGQGEDPEFGPSVSPAAGRSSQGLAQVEKAVQEDQHQLQDQPGSPQARSPAGLYSDSRRRITRVDE